MRFQLQLYDIIIRYQTGFGRYDMKNNSVQNLSSFKILHPEICLGSCQHCHRDIKLEKQGENWKIVQTTLATHPDELFPFKS